MRTPEEVKPLPAFLVGALFNCHLEFADGRNRFIVEAVLSRMDDDRLMESIRQIFREEMQAFPSVAMPEPSFSSMDEEMTEEQREENRKNVLADLDLFG